MDSSTAPKRREDNQEGCSGDQVPQQKHHKAPGGTAAAAGLLEKQNLLESILDSPGQEWKPSLHSLPVMVQTAPHLMEVREHPRTLRHHGESAPLRWL